MGERMYVAVLRLLILTGVMICFGSRAQSSMVFAEKGAYVFNGSILEPAPLLHFHSLDQRLFLNFNMSETSASWTFIGENAGSMGLYFLRLFVPGGDSLLVFSEFSKTPAWVFTARETKRGQATATPLLEGDRLRLEYRRHPRTVLEPDIHLEGIAYGTKASYALLNGMIAPESISACKVNVNCMPEGMRWQDEKNAVVRILLKKGSTLQIVTGALVNNTLQDATPYVLASDNAITGVSPADLLQTVFYFGQEFPGCDTLGFPLLAKTLTGAVEVASGGISCNLGSDFFLMKLNSYIPASYNPFFLGWDRGGMVVDSGVSIHFTGGMLKQIATFNSMLQHGYYGGGMVNTHWKLRWAATPNGFNTVGPGGEGAPLLDKMGRLIGTYTGGIASCSTPLDYDYFGKFSVSWDQNGATPQTRLREWLDPMNSGVVTLDGAYPAIFPPEAALSFSDTLVFAGDSIWFWDQSSGNPAGWEWHFPGGQPASWLGQHPTPVLYPSPGTYDVFLRVLNMYGSDSLLLTSRITVLPVSDTIRTLLDTLLTCADTVWLPLRVENFFFVKSGTLTLTLDTAGMQYLGLTYLHPALQAANAQVYLSSGELWIVFNAAQPFHLGDDTLAIIQVLVDAGNRLLTWNTFRPWKCKYYRSGGQAFPVMFQDGLIQAQACASLQVNLQYHLTHYGLSSATLQLVDVGGDTITAPFNALGQAVMPRLIPGTYDLRTRLSLPWGGVNASDALLILRHFVGLDTLTGLSLAAADADGGGFVNATDALMVARRFAGLIQAFPASDWITKDTLLPLVAGQHVLIFEAICRGDVNASRPLTLSTSSSVTVTPIPATSIAPARSYLRGE